MHPKRLRQAALAYADRAAATLEPRRSSDRAELSAALLAVVSDGTALDLLSRGRLCEIPETGLGGFGGPASADRSSSPSPPRSRSPSKPGRREDQDQQRIAEEAVRAAREAYERAARAAEADHAARDASAVSSVPPSRWTRPNATWLLPVRMPRPRLSGSRPRKSLVDAQQHVNEAESSLADLDG